MVTIFQCTCGAEYKRTETKFLVPHTGHADCKVCGTRVLVGNHPRSHIRAAQTSRRKACMKPHLKRPRDPAQLAKLMIDIASGEVTDGQPNAKQVRAHQAGTKGGPARARALPPEQRSEIARAATAARWKKGLARRSFIIA